MATKWTGNKVDKSQLNNGNEYDLDSDVAIEEFNAIVNNSLYASQISESVAEQLSNLDPDEKIEFKGSNPNLLINGDFRINQRGQEYTFEGSTNAYTFDRWNVSTSVGGSVTKTTSGVTVNLKGAWAAFQQKLEDNESLAGKTVTLSVKVKSYTQNAGTGYPCMQIVDSVGRTSKKFLSTTIGVQTVTRTIPEGATNIRISAFANYSSETVFDGTIEIEWAKLEIGSIATPYIPRPYAEELVLCKRYYQEIFNVSLAPSIYYAMSSRLIFPVEMRTTPTSKLFPADTTGNQISENEKTVYDTAASSEINTNQNGGYATKSQIAVVGGGQLTANKWYGYIFKLDAEI